MILASKRYLTVGSGSNSGVEEVEVNSTYYWKPVQGTSLSLCVVFAVDETDSRLESLSSKLLYLNVSCCKCDIEILNISVIYAWEFN